ncbi:MAG: hypothetical protein ACR2OY_05175 [Boseongicola sp.]
MVGKSVVKAIGLAVAMGLPSMAIADGLNTVVLKEVIAPAPAESKLTLRGGYGESNSEYPFAVHSGNRRIYEAGYGSGLYAHAAYANSRMFGSVGGEVSLSINKLSGDGKTPNTNCAFFEVIALSRRECADSPKTSSSTQFNQFRILATRGQADNGAQLLGGLSVLQLLSDIRGNANNIQENLSEYTRKTDYTGLGLVAGARKRIPITNNALLQLEGFVGAYSGDRDLNIDDSYSSDAGYVEGKLSNTNSQTVFSLDLTASVNIPAKRIAPGGMFEFGLAYTRLFNVMDTSNYNSSVAARPDGIYRPGSDSDDIDALSLFFGIQIPL